MAFSEYQTSKFSVTSLHSIDCAANRNSGIVRGILANDWVISVEAGQGLFRCAEGSVGSRRTFAFSSP